MNNYNWLQKKLHIFALHSQLIRETTFDVNLSISKVDASFGEHVFVCGMARSGTTAILNSLYGSDVFASLSYADMPFVLAPNIWSKLNLKDNNEDFVERAHGDGIKISTKSPEAFEEVFWRTFNISDQETLGNFKKYINAICVNKNKKRYLSKNNQNIKRLEHIIKPLIDSIFLVPFRDPLQHANSLLTQHKRFISSSQQDQFISTYMKLIGHTEFGPNYIPLYNEKLLYTDTFNINHWLEQWLNIYKSVFSLDKYKNLKFVCYESLCSDIQCWENLKGFASINNPDYLYEFRESKKEISEEIDNNLLGDCLKLYKELKQISI